MPKKGFVPLFVKDPDSITYVLEKLFYNIGSIKFCRSYKSIIDKNDDTADTYVFILDASIGGIHYWILIEIQIHEIIRIKFDYNFGYVTTSNLYIECANEKDILELLKTTAIEVRNRCIEKKKEYMPVSDDPHALEEYATVEIAGRINNQIQILNNIINILAD